jgi:hypothetical protein
MGSLAKNLRLPEVDWRYVTGSLIPAAPAVYLICGAAAAFLSWALFEPFFRDGGAPTTVGIANILIFPAVVGTIAAVLCVAHGMIGKLGDGLLAPAAAGFSVAFACAFLVLVPTQILFDRFESVMRTGVDHCRCSLAFVMLGRSLAWGFAVSSVGFGVYAGTRKPQLLVAGVSGGFVGGLMGGFLFDPIQVICSSPSSTHAWISRLIGFAVAGGMAAWCTGIAEDLTDRRSVLVTSGPCAGNRFTVDSGPCVIMWVSGKISMTEHLGATTPSAVIQKNGFRYVFTCVQPELPCLVNRRRVRRAHLRHGDRISIGGEDLLFSDPRYTD